MYYAAWAELIRRVGNIRSGDEAQEDALEWLTTQSGAAGQVHCDGKKEDNIS